MLIFRDIFKTHSDQNIYTKTHQTAPHFLNFLGGGGLAYALAYAWNYN